MKTYTIDEKGAALRKIIRLASKHTISGKDAGAFGRACVKLGLDTTATVIAAQEAEYGGFLGWVREGWNQEARKAGS